MHGKKAEKKRPAPADMRILKPEIEDFLENAYAQNYMIPNRIIPKQERPKWRFKVKAYIKSLQAVPPEGEDGITAAARDIAIQEAMKQRAAIYQNINISSKKKWNADHEKYERDEKANLLTELVFRLNILQCEYEEGIRYFKDNIRETDNEIILYMLLDLLYEYSLTDYWIKEYEEAVKKKVIPRTSLVKVYQYMKVYGELPDSFE